MSTQYAPGSWWPVKDSATGAWMLLRDVAGSGGRCELKKDADGALARWHSNEAAQCAAYLFNKETAIGAPS